MKIGRSCTGELLVFHDNCWLAVSPDGTATKEYVQMEIDNTVAEWVGGEFVTQGCTIKRGTWNVHISGAVQPKMNGEYRKMLGGYRNENNVWYVRSTAGQTIFVCSLGTTTKILGIRNTCKPMVVDASITSSEIKELYKPEYWNVAKRLVWNVRKTAPRTTGMFTVTVKEIDNTNNGRKSNSFV